MVLWSFLVVGAGAWTRLAEVESGSCESAGCQVTAVCPDETWPVACTSRGYAWLKEGACVASSPLDEEISVKAACTSMFRSFTVSGAGAACPSGSVLQGCFCEDCFTRAVPDRNGICTAEAGRAQALCLAGETHWLLQNAAGIGFVKYCGWAPYQRPQTLPAESYRNDTDCRYVLLDPVGSAGCSVEECAQLEDCIQRCDVCSTCSAVLQMALGSSRVRCYMQEKIHVTSLRPDSLDTGFFVNERNAGCETADEDRILTRGINGVKLFADLRCQTELIPDEVFIMDASGLVLFDSFPWVPRCADRRCDPGGLSIVASFMNPTVVRCATVQASARYAYGWRLSKTSSNVTLGAGIENLTKTVWQEVARSGKGMGVRATWDGVMEVEAGPLRNSFEVNTYTGENPALLPVVISLLVFFTVLCAVFLRHFHSHRTVAQRTARSAPLAVMLPPCREEAVAFSSAVTLDEITFDEEWHDVPSVSYLRSSEAAHLQNLLDFTYRSTLTHDRPCPNACGRGALCPCVQVGGDPGLPVAFHVLAALRLRGDRGGTAAPPAEYVKRRKEIQQKRAALKCLEMSSQLAVAKYPQLQEVLPELDPSSNEVFLWYGTNVRKAFDITGSKDAMEGLPLAESCTKADEHATDEAGGHYDQVFALVLCRVCLGRFYYTTETVPKAEEEVKKGQFDSILLDRWGEGSREFLVYNLKQVSPEFLILYRRLYENQDPALDGGDFRLEVPIYWSSLHRQETYRSQPLVSKTLQRVLQGLVEASSTSGRHLITSARQIEDSRLWQRYTRAQGERRLVTRITAIQGAIEVTGLDCAVDELLLWYFCSDAEEAASASEGSFQSSPRQRRAGIHLSESLSGTSREPGPSLVLLCRVTLGEVQCIDLGPDLAQVQSARAAGKDALVAFASRGRKEFVLFREEQIYPQFLLELSKTE